MPPILGNIIAIAGIVLLAALCIHVLRKGGGCTGSCSGSCSGCSSCGPVSKEDRKLMKELEKRNARARRHQHARN